MSTRPASRCSAVLASLLVLLAGANACGTASEPGAEPSATGTDGTSPAASPSGATTAPAPPSSAAPSAPPAEAGAPEAGPPNPYAGGAVINAPAGTWTYVPMNDVVCGNGSTSGVSVNPSSTPGAPLLVFMMGGGACWNELTCLGGAASNVSDAVGAADIATDIPRVAALFDRTATDNPFRDASFVFVPYCTGDLHAGDTKRTYSVLTKKVTIEHRGARNTDAIVKRLLATFPSPPKVWLTGASGGGYGAMLSHHRFKSAWPATRIDMLNDCGPPVQPTGSTWSDMQSAWKLELPPGCAGCATDVSKLLPHLASSMGQGRLALMEYTQDKTIRSFTGRVLAQDFTNQVLALKAAMGPRQRSYLVEGDTHVLLKQHPLPVASSGVTLPTWLTRFATDDAAWAHEGP
jgi:hypothetical protein